MAERDDKQMSDIEIFRFIMVAGITLNWYLACNNFSLFNFLSGIILILIWIVAEVDNARR